MWGWESIYPKMMLLGVSRLESTSWMLPRWFVPRALNPPVHNSGPWEISEGQSVESLKTSGEANMGFNPLYGNLRFHDWFHDRFNKCEQRIDDD